MDLSNKITNIISALDKINLAYNQFKDQNLIIGDWVIINEEIYNKYKNKIIITNINFIAEPEMEQAIPAYPVISLKMAFETKKYYGVLKYNINFIAFNISEREYSALTDSMNLVAVNRNLQNNYNNNITKPPKLLDVLEAIGWKITAKAKKEIKEKANFLNYKE